MILRKAAVPVPGIVPDCPFLDDVDVENRWILLYDPFHRLNNPGTSHPVDEKTALVRHKTSFIEAYYKRYKNYRRNQRTEKPKRYKLYSYLVYLLNTNGYKYYSIISL